MIPDIPKTVIVTGASQGIGAGLVKAFLERGHNVVATSRSITKTDGFKASDKLADEKYYTDLPGGLLEAAGRLYKRSVKMFVYPTRDPVTSQIQTLETVHPPAPWHHLQRLLRDIAKVVPIRSYNESYLSIHTPDVLARIQVGDPAWETTVPAVVAEVIKTKNLFRSR